MEQVSGKKRWFKFPIPMTVKTAAGAALKSREAITERLKAFAHLFSRNPSLEELALFTREFAGGVATGIPLVDWLKILAGKQTNTRLREALERVIIDLQQGSTVSQALQRHPRLFDEDYCRIIMSGETTSTFIEALGTIADALEAKVRLSAEGKSSRVLHSGSTLFLGIIALGAMAGLGLDVIFVVVALVCGLGAAWYLVHQALHAEALSPILRVGFFSAGFLLGLEGLLVVGGVVAKAFL